jgi:hypothetical protein
MLLQLHWTLIIVCFKPGGSDCINWIFRWSVPDVHLEQVCANCNTAAGSCKLPRVTLVPSLLVLKHKSYFVGAHPNPLVCSFWHPGRLHWLIRPFLPLRDWSQAILQLVVGCSRVSLHWRPCCRTYETSSISCWLCITHL